MGHAWAPAMLTCILQGALAGVIAHAIHTDTTIDTVVLHTIICVHSTGRPFEARRTGTPVVGVEEGAGQRMKRNWGKPVAMDQNPISHSWSLYSRPGPCQRVNRSEGNKTSPALMESSGLPSGGGDK